MAKENNSISQNDLYKIAGHGENDLTRMFALILNYNRNFLEKLLQSFDVIVDDKINDVKIVAQDYSQPNEGIPDIVISLNNKFEIFIEAKLESITHDTEQLKRHYEKLYSKKNNNLVVRLVYLTKYAQGNIYEELKADCRLTDDEIIYCRWMKQFENIDSIYNILKNTGKTTLPENFYNDFLDYMGYLAQPDDFFIGQIKDRHQWDKLFSDQSYEFEFQIDCKPLKGAEYFLPYKMTTEFEKTDIQPGIDHCARVTHIEINEKRIIIKFDKLKRFINERRIDVRERKIPCGYTDLITLKKALIKGRVDIKYPLQDPQNGNWEQIEIPGEWKDCLIEKLLIE